MGDLKTFRVPFEAAESEFTEKRSRFISHLVPAETEEEAQEHIKSMKGRYHDARHNCWCYLIGENTMRYSDDGEPQGTAGQPMLKIFEREHVTNVCCVVTRYFGGILLGAGGLTRAYARGAKDVLVKAGAATMGLWSRVEIPCVYPLFERLKLEIAALDGIIDDTEYGADIRLQVSLPSANTNLMQHRLTELSGGQLQLQVRGEEFRPGPREEIQ